MADTERLRQELEKAQAIVIGAGAGLSTAAGLSYSGERFQKNFGDLILRYHFTDMYSAGFYPFETQEEKWAYWSRHIYYNRYDQPGMAVYKDLLGLVKDKDYFVITTNVDHQFWLSGFKTDRIFATQGDYGQFQCARGCHGTLYDNEESVRAMMKTQKNGRVPSRLIPKCPVCFGNMEVHLRCDQFFVEDEAWRQASQCYQNFLRENQQKRILFLELGVGFNTPVIIKYPFWQMTAQWSQAFYACINLGQAWAPDPIKEKSLCIDGDIAEIISKV